ncbi:hypothetical protein DL98DRAFT_517066 [Cadophora sp. DSE1049]|nr:hypothetical protein DL98DRAFT_517066 [Cadophora sp. DSE1049]
MNHHYSAIVPGRTRLVSPLPVPHSRHTTDIPKPPQMPRPSPNGALRHSEFLPLRTELILPSSLPRYPKPLISASATESDCGASHGIQYFPPVSSSTETQPHKIMA